MFRELLEELLRTPGADFCCVADSALGKVLASSGEEEGAAVSLAVLGWGATAAGYLGSATSDDLDDMIVTSRRAYHLVRSLDGESGQPLLIYLRLDRRRANLALARRALAGARLVPRSAEPELPRQRTATGTGGPPARLPVAAVAAVAPATAAPPATRRAPLVPLPRRQPAALPSRRVQPQMPARARPVPAPRSTDPVLAQRWADDVPTMQRLLAGLRKLR